MKRKVLIVEDEYELALNLKEQILKLGFSVPAVFDNARETLAYLEENSVDLLLVDIMIEGSMDGIGLVGIINKKWGLPIVFSTAYAETELFTKALEVNPAGYLVKPYKMDDLKTTLMLAFSKIDRIEHEVRDSPAFLKVRDKGFLIFLHAEEIILAQADGLYTKIITRTKSYVVRDILKDVEEKLPAKLFLRVHKSFLVNKMHIRSFNGRNAVVDEYTVPIRRGLYKHLQEVVTKRF
ncbi:LytR/AlgR family response regulator transcription factor [Cyclobacterium xiamenense]|uniref:LytR/AlgR family response regulator transcription factor n=1 Tax=Cyclobacterium xiamenense TaxID=1297121 RepID=UPI0035CF7EC9